MTKIIWRTMIFNVRGEDGVGDMKTLKELIHELNREKEVYRYHQIQIENLKDDAQYGYDPYDYPDMSEWDYQMAVQKAISGCSFVLKTTQERIKELRKKIKTLQRGNNEKEYQDKKAGIND